MIKILIIHLTYFDYVKSTMKQNTLVFFFVLDMIFIGNFSGGKMQKNLSILIVFIFVTLISASCGQSGTSSKKPTSVKEEIPLTEGPTQEVAPTPEFISCIVRYEDQAISPNCVEFDLSVVEYDNAVGFCIAVVGRNGVTEIVEGHCPEVIE